MKTENEEPELRCKPYTDRELREALSHMVATKGVRPVLEGIICVLTNDIENARILAQGREVTDHLEIVRSEVERCVTRIERLP